MARAEQVSPTEWNVYETVSDTDSRLYWVTSLDRNIPTGEQIEAGLDANGDSGIHSGSEVPVSGENGPYPQTGLDAAEDYATHFVQNISDYKGFLQSYAGGLLGPGTFTRAGTQDGVDADGNGYTAAENVPAYILSPPEGMLLQKADFGPAGETSLRIDFAEVNLNPQAINFSGQLIFTIRTDWEGLGSSTLLSINFGPAWGDSFYINISPSGATVYATKLAGGSGAYAESAITHNAVIGDRFDIRFRYSSVTGIDLWEGPTWKANNPSTTPINNDADYIIVGARWNDDAEKANFTCELIRIVDADLSTEEIEAW